MDPATIIAGVSAAAALVSAVFAVRSSRSSKRSATVAVLQAQLTYQTSVGAWEPSVSLDIDGVRYRWAKDSIVWDEGAHADPGLRRDARVTLSVAKQIELFVEVLATGRLVNHRSQPMLLTFHDSDRAARRLPLQNQRIFLVDGVDRRRAILAPGEELEFMWIDRRSFDHWREHFIAFDEQNQWDDDELKPPSETRGKISKIHPPWKAPRYDKYQAWRSSVLGRSGFRIVADSRVADRISEVWEVELGQSPVTPTGRDEQSQKLRWRLRPDVNASVDDDVVRYRCHQDTTLAQLETPRMRKVPGRF